MLAYKLTGFTPDFCEQCMMTVADIFTTKEQALDALALIKNEIISTLSEEKESMTHFSTDETRYYGDTRFVASCTINVMCNPKQQKHREMLFDFSQILARLSLTRRQEVALRLLRQLIVDARHTDSRLRKNFAGRLMRRCARAYSRNYSDKISIINHAYFDNGLQVNEYQTI